jgi:phosphoglycolate phosphatase
MSGAPLVVFDLDGTLVDSAPDIAAAVNRMLAARRLSLLSQAAVAAMVGDGLHVLMDRVFAAAGTPLDPAAADEYLADYEANVLVETALFPGIEAALDQLAAAGCRLAVCTNKPEHATHLLLAGLGVADRFVAVGGGDSFAARKPHPLHLAGTIARAGGSAARALMVGDHRNDILAATGCAVRPIFAGWGYGHPGMEQGAAAIAAMPADLPGIVARLVA